MYSFRLSALLLALVLPALHVVQAQSSSSSSNPATPAATQSQDQAQQPAAESQPQLSVAARIKARREQRRVAAIHEVYDHLYDGYVGAGFQRTYAGVPQKVNEYNWNGGFTRYYNERLGLTLDGRGYYGTPFVGINFSGITSRLSANTTCFLDPVTASICSRNTPLHCGQWAATHTETSPAIPMDLPAKRSVSIPTVQHSPSAAPQSSNTIWPPASVCGSLRNIS